MYMCGISHPIIRGSTALLQLLSLQKTLDPEMLASRLVKLHTFLLLLAPSGAAVGYYDGGVTHGRSNTWYTIQQTQLNNLACTRSELMLRGGGRGVSLDQLQCGRVYIYVCIAQRSNTSHEYRYIFVHTRLYLMSTTVCITQ